MCAKHRCYSVVALAEHYMLGRNSFCAVVWLILGVAAVLSVHHTFLPQFAGECDGNDVDECCLILSNTVSRSTSGSQVQHDISGDCQTGTVDVGGIISFLPFKWRCCVAVASHNLCEYHVVHCDYENAAMCGVESEC